MKTLIDKTTKVAHFLWEDSQVVEMKTNMIQIGNPVEFNIEFLDSSSGELIENVSDPSDFWGGKYKYVEGQWVNNHPTDDGVTYEWKDNIWTWDKRDDAENPVPPSEQWKNMNLTT